MLLDELEQRLGSAPKEVYRVLILDDSLFLLEYYALILKESGMLVHAIVDPYQLFQQLYEFNPDLILMDF